MGPPTRRNVQDEERVALAKKLLSFNDDDSSFLEKTGVLIEKYHIRPPAVTVTYQDLTVTTRALVGASAIPTVGNALIGLLLRVVGMSPRRAETDLKILDGLNGILKPGRLTLLLGPPSCGKSTMMKVLSGRLRETPIMHTAGKITYNGVEMDKFHAQRTSAYVDQMDNHNGNLTVQETLLYAHACQSGLHGTPFQIAQDMLATRNAGKGDASTAEFEEVLHKAMVSDARVAVWMNMVGLIHCKDTNVGDAMNRGISGGEKKRVTMAEMLVGPRNVMFLDEISTGLDSATLFTIVKSLSQMSHASRPTCLVSLLQPPPETFQLFDDVIMIADGVILYHGPVTDVIPFFNTLGFDCPPRKDIPSFLLEVTTSAGQLNYATAELRRTMGLPAAEAQPVAEGVSKEKMLVLRKELIVPVKNMAAMFWKDNEHGQAMLRELGVPIDPSSTHPGSLVNTSYALSAWESIVVTTKRQATLMMRDQVLLKARMIQTVVISLITGSLFYMLPITENGARSYFGACFMSILFLAFGGFPQLPITLEMKKVFFKHRENYFIPAYAQGIAMAVVQMPVSFLEVTLFSLIIYFMVGFYMAPSYFFTFFAICFSLSLVASGLFRFIACLSPDMVIGNALGGLAIVLLIVTSGFVIVKGSIPPWMIWAYYISPFSYAMRALVINEFSSPRWQDLPAPGVPGETLGNYALGSFDFYTNTPWIWGGLGFNFGMYILLTIGSIIALAYLHPETPRAQIPDQSQLEAARQQGEERRKTMNSRRMDANSVIIPVTPGKGTRKDSSEDDSNSEDLDMKSSRTNPALMHSPSSSLNKGGQSDISSSLPFTPITLVFKDIRYFVPNPRYDKKAARAAARAKQTQAEMEMTKGSSDPTDPKAKTPPLDMTLMEELQLLKGLTGYAEPGVLTALMGGSGAGKTTLMDVIAGRKTVGRIQGDIYANGHLVEQRSWSRVMGYCEQFDIHSPAQTVREALVFSARLRMPPSVSDEKVDAYVDEVLDIVDLMDIMYNLVGIPGTNGLSVEQRKRLTIAVELVSNPSVVFMDEPTSGLDARAATTVMRAVRNVARNNRTVIVTIHQPSIEIFEAFDMLLLLQRGGSITYFGALGSHSQNLIDYLCQIPGTPELPNGYNPATWMLEVTGGSMATVVKAVNADWPSVYRESELCKSNLAYAHELVERDSKQCPKLEVQSQYAMPFRAQMSILLRKFTLAYWRSPSYNMVRLLVTLLVSILYGTTYYKKGQVGYPATLGEIQNVIGIMFSSSNFLGMTNLMSAMAVIGYERVVFYRERGASMYDPFAYGYAMAMVEMPYLLVQSLCFVPIMYWMVLFLPTPEAFFHYFIMFFETVCFYTIFGQFLVYITPNAGIAQVLGGLFNYLFNIFNGFVITYPAMPSGWHWMNRFSPPTWILYGLGVSQLGQSEVPMDPTLVDGQVLPVWQYVQQQFGYDYSMRWWCVLILLAYILFVRVTSILALKYWNFLRR